ncbi:MAG: hypothetical protein AAGC60_08210 [Acidobacteriota bacterium]
MASADESTLAAAPGSEASEEAASPEGAPQTDVVEDSSVLLVGVDSAAVACLGSVGLDVEILAAGDLAAADVALGGGSFAVLVLRVDDDAAGALGETAILGFLDRLAARHPFQRPAIVVLGVADRARLQPLVQEDRLYYTSADLLADELARLVAAALEDFRRRLAIELAGGLRSRHPRALERRHLLGLAESLRGATRLSHALEPVREAVDALFADEPGDQAADAPASTIELRLWQLDDVESMLRTVGEGGDAGTAEVSAAAGLVGWSARTGDSLRVETAGSDPRFDAEVDGAGARLLAAAIVGPETEVLGVVAIERSADAPPFSAREQRWARAVADHLVPVFARHAPRPLDAALRERLAGSSADIFRRQAIEAHGEGLGERGMLLRLESRWARWTWRLLLVGLLLALLVAGLVPLRDTARVDVVVAEVAGDQARLVALVPPRLAASLTLGRQLAVSIDGLESPASRATVRALSGLVAPVEREAAVGAELAMRAVPGATVRLEASMSAQVEAHGRSWTLRPGLHGTLQVERGTKTLFQRLVPGRGAEGDAAGG